MENNEFVVHVVDPDPAIADGLETLLSTYGIQVSYFPDAETLLERQSRLRLDHGCLLVEADLPGMSGPAMLQQLCDECADVPVLLLVSTSYPELIEVARSSSRIGVIEKPFTNGTLIDEILRLRRQP